MKPLSQKLLILASLLMAVSYFTPIWQIKLAAPQYPEGMGLHIWLNKVTGERPTDLNTINSLNHYIGMKEITPESIPELKLMPYIVAFLIAFGLIAAVTRKRRVMLAWVIVMLLLLFGGLIDFYLWEYDYGHNLNPNAPIKVPGMSYQPPLIGTKQLLNMRTTSLPHIGGVAIGVSMMLGFLALWISRPWKK